jgi:hypothetical protein
MFFTTSVDTVFTEVLLGVLRSNPFLLRQYVVSFFEIFFLNRPYKSDCKKSVLNFRAAPILCWRGQKGRSVEPPVRRLPEVARGFWRLGPRPPAAARWRGVARQEAPPSAGLATAGMAEGGTGPARAPFECVCGFTAGTSFAWEKHLALRNTPYSSVKHSRVIRAAGEPSPPHKSQFEYDSPQLGLSRLGTERDADPETSGLSLPPYPTPKALFRDRPPLDSTPSKPLPTSPYTRSPSPTSSRSVINGLRLEEAAKRGDMDRVARLAVEILRLAQQGDPEGVLDVISDRGLAPSRPPLARAPAQEIKFAASITAVHQRPSGIAIEQVRFRCARACELPPCPSSGN